MNPFYKAFDFFTNKSSNTTKESEVYQKALNEINTLEDLLDCFLEEDTLSEYPDLYQSYIINLQSIKSSIFMYQKRKATAKSEKERIALEQEIQQLKIKYQKAYNQLKDTLLALNRISDLNNHLTELKVLIYKHATFEAFAPFLGKQNWKVEDLENLKQAIGVKMSEIINYNGKLR